MSAEMCGILTLNDDCLYEIFQKLTLEEQLILTDVCRRFRDIIFEYIWKKDLPTLKDLNDLSILKVIHCNGERSHQNDIELFSEKCLQLHDGHMKLISEKCPQLEEIEIYSKHITDTYVNKLKNLKVLKAPWSTFLAKHLNSILPNLTHLMLYDIPDIEHLQLENNINLSHFMISCKVLSRDFGIHLENMKGLKNLSVTYEDSEIHRFTPNLISFPKNGLEDILLGFEETLSSRPSPNWLSFSKFLNFRCRGVECELTSTLHNILKALAHNMPILYNIVSRLDILLWKSFNYSFLKYIWSPEPSLELHCFSKNEPSLEIMKWILQVFPITINIFYYMDTFDIDSMLIFIRALKNHIECEQFLTFNLVMQGGINSESEISDLENKFEDLLSCHIFSSLQSIELKLEFDPLKLRYNKLRELHNVISFIVN